MLILVAMFFTKMYIVGSSSNETEYEKFWLENFKVILMSALLTLLLGHCNSLTRLVLKVMQVHFD